MINTSDYLSDIDLDIPFETFTLDNGLTVIVHENHQSSQVAVNIWYRVGSKDEPQGKSGLAHLFEHLMFGGSEHLPGSYIDHLQGAGALVVNGTTSQDRTNYFQTVPLEALDFTLFAESDRMGHFLPTLDQSLLDRQRRVVMNEKEEKEDAPYGKIFSRQVKACYPASHPYAHTVFGEAQDLHHITLEDAQAWFRKWYTPSNAILTLAGAIDLTTAKTKVIKYFGHIPAGAPLERPQVWVTPIDAGKREVLEDRVVQGRISLTWNLPPYGNRQTDELTLLASILTGDNNSLLYQKLVVVQSLASKVSARVDEGQLVSQFTISALVHPGVKPGQVELAIIRVLQQLFKQGIDPQALQQVKIRWLAEFIKRHGTMTAIADLLCSHQGMLGDASRYRQTLTQIKQTGTGSLLATAQHWLNDQYFTLEVQPFNATGDDSIALPREVPAITSPGDAATLPIQYHTLDNGIRIVFTEKQRHPVTQISLLIPRGSARESQNDAGVTNLLCQLIDQGGTANESSLSFTSSLQALGAEIYLDVAADMLRVNLSSLTATLPQALQKFADRVITPRYSEDEFNRCRALQIEQITQSLTFQEGIVHTLLPQIIYPEDHPYARASYGIGTRETLSSLRYEQLEHSLDELLNPTDATLLVVSSAEIDEVLPQLNKLFGQWQKTHSPASFQVENVRPLPARAFLVDKPGATQTTITAATLVPPLEGRIGAAFSLVHDLLANGFSSRLNTLLREEKNWTYGVHALLSHTRATRLHGLMTTVQADRSAETIAEIKRVYCELKAACPVTETELEKLCRSELLRLGVGAEGTEQTLAHLRYLLEQNLPDTWWQTYAKHIATLTVNELNDCVQTLIQPSELSWIVVGDLAIISDDIRRQLPKTVIVVDLFAGDAISNNKE